MEISDQTIRDILKNACTRVDFSRAKPEASLRQAGMDSMEIANIMLGVEEACGIKIPDSDLDGLDSIAAIVSYVRTKKAGQ